MTRIATLLFIFALSNMTQAANNRELPSCYEVAQIDSQYKTNINGRSLVVAIDGTFGPDGSLKRNVHQKIQEFIQPGDHISIIGFSAYVNGNYTQINFSGTLDTDINNRDDVNKSKLSKFDSCLIKQRSYFKKKIDDSIDQSFKKSETDIPNTEIINNLSNSISPIIQNINSDKIVLVIVSDMLENSDITTFYKSGSIRLIDQNAEFEKVKTANMTGDFNNALVYVIGSGWVQDKGFKGGKSMKAINLFWEMYFSNSNAKLMEFGQPMMLGDIK